MVKVLSVDDEVFGTFKKPSSTYFAIEKSMYRSISNRMLHLFASIKEFNNLIGEPVNKYRMNYKHMEKLREIFFRKVQNDIPDLQKYLDYYKWLDTAMTEMLDQLMPSSARYAPNVRNLVESHALERNKIQHRAPLLKPPGSLSGGNEITGDINGNNTQIGVEGAPGSPASNPRRRPANPNPGDLGGDQLLPPEQINVGRLQDWARNFDPDRAFNPGQNGPNFG